MHESTAMSTPAPQAIGPKPRESQQNPVLPELPYSLHTRKLSIFLTWTIIWFWNSGLIQILYFSIRYGTNVRSTMCCVDKT